MMKNHYFVMFVIMILSGLLSTMNIWVDNISDIRYSINDVYMTLLMCGWMFLFMGIYYKEINIFILGLFLVIVIIFCIRTQLFVSQKQYELGMIPHHSMAIFMSKKLLKKKNTIQPFLHKLINTQKKEIQFLKNNNLF
jgi:hypothetical protein